MTIGSNYFTEFSVILPNIGEYHMIVRPLHDLIILPVSSIS